VYLLIINMMRHTSLPAGLGHQLLRMQTSHVSTASAALWFVTRIN
jgi:hypothetical protein